MAIMVNIYYTGESGNARRFAEEMVAAGIVRQIRAEPGNLKYEYFFPMDDKETVLLIAAVIYIIKRRKSGRHFCGGDCEVCGLCAEKHNKGAENEK